MKQRAPTREQSAINEEFRASQTGRRPSLQVGGRVALVDGLLDRETHEAIWEFFTGQTFYTNPEGKFSPVYRLTDGQSLVSTSTVLRIHAQRSNNLPGAIGSSSNPLSRLFREMLSVPEVQFVLSACEPWNVLTFNSTIFPPGTGLGWHADGGHSAAFIYYAHPQWRDSWGGELLLDGSTASNDLVEANFDPVPRPGSSHQDLYRNVSGAFVASGGYGTFIEPKPNRLVVLASGVRHTVKKVEMTAGEAFRAAVSGFFSDLPPDALTK